MTLRAETLVPYDTHDTYAPQVPQDGPDPATATEPEEESGDPVPSSGRLGLRLGCALFAAPGAPDAARVLLGLPPETAAQEPAESAGPTAAVLPWWPRPTALGTPPDRRGRPGR